MEPLIGVCSWSLRAHGPRALVELVRAVGVEAVQLHLDPLRTGAWEREETLRSLTAEGIALRSGMMAMAGEDYASLESIRRTGGLRPDERWAENRAAAEANASLAAELGLDLVSFHAGFLPEDPGDPERAALLARLSDVADLFAARGVRVALETGQETAETLLGVLEELGHPSVGVNFDPANMVLYDQGDPVAALEALAPFVRQVHVKDARRTRVPGTWGEEVPAGAGDVDWTRFFDVLRKARLACDLMIEREAGDERVADVRRARGLVQRHLTRTHGER